MAWPITVTQLLTMALGLVETAIVGRVSTTELAGVAIGRTVAFAASTLAMGVAMSLEPLAAQAVGAGEEGRAWEGLKTTLAAVLALAPLLMTLALLATRAFEPLGVGQAIATRALAYEIGQAPGLAFFVVYLAGRTFLQAHGKTASPLIAAAIANGVNVVVCNLLVRGDAALTAVGLSPRGLPSLGAFGAGVAFSVATFVQAVVTLVSCLPLRPREPAAAVPVRLSLRLGMPIGLQLLAEIGVFTVAVVLVGRFGAAATSAHQVAIGLASFTFMGALGVSTATSVRVGYAVGEGRSPRRAGLLGIGVGAAYMSLTALVFALVPGLLVGLFTTDPETARLGVSLLLVAAVFQLFDGVQCVSAGALRGAGDVRFPFLANVGAHWGVGFPLACIFGFKLGLGVKGIWYGLTVGLIVIAGLLGARFVRISRERVARI